MTPPQPSGPAGPRPSPPGPRSPASPWRHNHAYRRPSLSPSRLPSICSCQVDGACCNRNTRRPCLARQRASSPRGWPAPASVDSRCREQLEYLIFRDARLRAPVAGCRPRSFERKAAETSELSLARASMQNRIELLHYYVIFDIASGGPHTRECQIGRLVCPNDRERRQRFGTAPASRKENVSPRH